MKSALVFSLLFSLAFASSLRTERSALQFQGMIECLTDRSAIWDYNGYGCWCGLGGKGDPVDATDRVTWRYKPSPYNMLCKGTADVSRCCRTHDRCYDSLKKSGECKAWELYFKGYSYSTKNCDTTTASVTCSHTPKQMLAHSGVLTKRNFAKVKPMVLGLRRCWGSKTAGSIPVIVSASGKGDKGNDCEVGLCQCDRTAAFCFRRSAFNPKYRYWSNWKC